MSAAKRKIPNGNSSNNNDGINAGTSIDVSDRTRRKQVEKIRRQREEEQAALIRKLKLILSKPSNVRTTVEQNFLKQHPCEVEDAQRRLKLKLARSSRIVESIDSDTLFDAKCRALAKCLREAKHAIVYVGAGLSTTSNIPDYRSTTNGTYYKVKKHDQIDDHCKISLANEPNFSHMALKAMLDQNLIKYIVSQNCDGLFLRCGVEAEQISEIHGNQFVECCQNCAESHATDPSTDKSRYFYRTFDVTQKTAYRRHRTDRTCNFCSAPLCDTIVLSGETSRTERPACWRRAASHASRADLILCLGTSLTVIKHYDCLWPATLKQLIIVSLQWTCKDTKASVKINACCSDVLRKTAEILKLDVSEYKYPESDALLRLVAASSSDKTLPETTDIVKLPNLNVAADYNSLYVPGWLKASVKSSITANAKVVAANNSSERASKKRRRTSQRLSSRAKLLKV